MNDSQNEKGNNEKKYLVLKDKNDLFESRIIVNCKTKIKRP